MIVFRLIVIECACLIWNGIVPFQRNRDRMICSFTERLSRSKFFAYPPQDAASELIFAFFLKIQKLMPWHCVSAYANPTAVVRFDLCLIRIFRFFLIRTLVRQWSASADSEGRQASGEWYPDITG